MTQSGRDLLVVQSNFADDIEIRSFGLNHEKFAHRDRVFEHNIGDVEIMGNHYQVRKIAVFQNFLHNAFPIQFSLLFRYGTRWPEILNRRRATERKLAGVNAATIGTAQNLSDRDAVRAKGVSDVLGLLYTQGRKVDFLRAIPGREMSYPFSDVDVSVAQQDNLAAVL